jgi:NitT/TauT family transport system substrate-binding protein
MLTSLAHLTGRFVYSIFSIDIIRFIENAPEGTVRKFRNRLGPIALVVAALTIAAACGSSSKNTAAGTGGNGGSNSGSSVTLRLGYQPNVTHSPAIVGLQNNTFANDLGANVKLQTSTYNSGTDETTAILAGSLDAAFVGPNPAINA